MASNGKELRAYCWSTGRAKVQEIHLLAHIWYTRCLHTTSRDFAYQHYKLMYSILAGGASDAFLICLA